jgi:hypothetical protein
VHLEKSVTLPQRTLPGSLARGRFALARTLAVAPKQTPADAQRARELAEAARSELSALVNSYPVLRPDLDAVELWLRGRE